MGNIDADGLLDIVVSKAPCALNQPNQHRGGLTFSDVSAVSGTGT